MKKIDYQYGIIVIGYKNVKGLRRLLKCICTAEYDGKDTILLIISLDKSDNEDEMQFVNEYLWPYGDKVVIRQKERLGLRKHILTCGNYLNEYGLDAVAVFEDDVIPARDFFSYMKSAVKAYYNDMRIAGISLYTFPIALNVGKEFSPILSEGDVYFLQYAQSWGQVWMRNQWNSFKEWYRKNSDKVEEDYRIPENVSKWNDNSWLKFHIKYCITENKYFVYPFSSHSTCFNEKGEHTQADSDLCQVVMSNYCKNDYNCVNFDGKALKYDAFFENIDLYQYCNVPQKELTVDLYAGRLAVNTRYLLTSRYLNYPIVRSWGNRLKPHDMNIINDIPGNDIFLYDLGSRNSWVDLPGQNINGNKFKQYFDMFDKWFELIENGKNISEYFEKNAYKTMAIYGFGKVGKHFFNAISKTKIKIEYVIDQSTKEVSEDIIVKKPEDMYPLVDVIVVTPVFDYEKIKWEIGKKYSGKVISLKELIEEIII